MARIHNGLGRDFYSLLDDNSIDVKGESLTSLRVNLLDPRKDQPRKTFDQEDLQLLADSISEHGVIQPIVVREIEGTDRYEIIAGERRWRASKIAGLDEIPAVIMTGDDLKIAEIALIENVQRKDLNPVEEALAYRALIDNFHLTQEEVSRQAGKSRSAIANMLRLLELPDDVLLMLRDGSLSMGHARAILGLDDEDAMLPLAEKTVDKELSVREVEKLVRQLNAAAENEGEETAEPEDKTAAQRRVYMKDLESRIMSDLGRKVKIHETPRKKTLELTYEDDEDLEALLRRIIGDNLFD